MRPPRLIATLRQLMTNKLDAQAEEQASVADANLKHIDLWNIAKMCTQNTLQSTILHTSITVSESLCSQKQCERETYSFWKKIEDVYTKNG